MLQEKAESAEEKTRPVTRKRAFLKIPETPKEVVKGQQQISAFKREEIN